MHCIIIHSTDEDAQQRLDISSFLQSVFKEARTPLTTKAVSAVQLSGALQQQAPDLIIIEATSTLQHAKNLVQHVREATPRTPIFMLYHRVAEPLSNKQKKQAITELKSLGATAFADTVEDALSIPSRILKTAGINFDYQYIPPVKSVLLMGSIQFDLLACQAFSIKHPPEEVHDEQTDNPWKPVGHAAMRAVFAIKSPIRTHPPNADNRENLRVTYYLNQHPSVSLTMQESLFLHLLDELKNTTQDWNTEQAIALRLVKFEESTLIPDHHTISELRTSILTKLARFTDTPEIYILYDEAHGLYRLNEQDLSIPAPPTLDEIDAMHAQALNEMNKPQDFS